MPVHISDIMQDFAKNIRKMLGILLTVLSCMVLVQEEIILNFRILT